LTLVPTLIDLLSCSVVIHPLVVAFGIKDSRNASMSCAYETRPVMRRQSIDCRISRPWSIQLQTQIL